MNSRLCCAAAICTVILARVDWPAEARKAQEALAAAALTAAEDAGAADEEAPGNSAGGSQAQHHTGEQSLCRRSSQACGRNAVCCAECLEQTCLCEPKPAYQLM